MKRLILLIILVAGMHLNLYSHGFGVHMAHVTRILNLNDNYRQIIQNYEPYFLYGATFPDIQYAVSYKQTLQEIYKKAASYWFTSGVRGEINMDQIPDYQPQQYPFGFDTHHEQNGIKFAEYMLEHSNQRFPGGYHLGNAADAGSDQVNQQIAFALGYYSHLCEDIACHDFLVPRITAQLNLGDLQIVKNGISFSTDPNNQMEAIIEAMDEYNYGDYNLVKQTIYNDIYVQLGQAEPAVPLVFYDNQPYSDADYFGMPNPILNFYLTCAQNFLAENPDARKNDPITIDGLIELAHVFRFANQFYPESCGHGKLDNALANWIGNHIEIKEGLSIGVDLVVGSVLSDIIQQNIPRIAARFSKPQVDSKMGTDIHTLISIMLSDLPTADNLVANNPEQLDANEYNKLKNSVLFTNPTGLLESIINENMDLGTYIYRWVGPSPPAPGNPDGRKWYTDWSPWHNQSMRWGALSSLNNLMPQNLYYSNPNIGVYDAYFTLNGQKITSPISPGLFANNPAAKITTELYNTTVTNPLNIILRVKKDNIANNYDLDQTVATTTFTINQNPL